MPQKISYNKKMPREEQLLYLEVFPYLSLIIKQLTGQ